MSRSLTMPQVLDRCFLLRKSPPVFIQLGRTGDLLLLFPAFKLIHDRTGLNPIVIVSTDYANVFDGISYATPYPITGHWFKDMPKARQIAAEKFGEAMIPHWWHDNTLTDVPKGPMILQCHGHFWDCDWKKYPDFGTSMWNRAGFTREEMVAAPLVIDRRNLAREDALCKRYILNDRPLLLYNFTGLSSPFGYTPEVMRLLAPYRQHFNMLDLGTVRAERIYDLLGLFDRAVGIVTIDTATLHLCPATETPSLMLIVDGWGQSVPRGNCVFHCFYSETPRNLNRIQAVLESWKTCSTTSTAPINPRLSMPSSAMPLPA